MVKTKRNLLLVILSVVFAFTLISFVAVKPVNAEETAVIAMKETASIRLDHYESDGRNGIRFTGYVGKDVVLSTPVDGEFLSTDTYAGIIVTRGVVEAEELTHEDDIIDVVAYRYDPDKNTETAKAFNAVIYNIPESAYAQDLTARAYLYSNGTYTYSDEVCTRTLAGVASHVLVEDEPTPEDRVVLESYVNAVNPVLKIGDTVINEGFDNVLTMKSGDILPITVEPADYAYEINIEEECRGIKIENNMLKAIGGTESQQLYVDIAGKFCAVTVNVEPWDDEDLADGVLLDFNEEGYVSKVLNLDSVRPISATAITGEEAMALGSNDGLLHVRAQSYGAFEFEFDEPVTVADCGGLYFRMRTDIPLHNNRLMHVQISFKKTDGTYTTVTYLDQYARTITQYNANEMFTFYTFKMGDIQDAALAAELSAIDQVCGIKFSSYSDPTTINSHVNFYFDEFGVLKLKEGQTEVVGFNDKYDSNLTWMRWTPGAQVLMPTDAGYPADKGADTGVLEVQRGNNPAHYYLTDRIVPQVGDKIVVRVYVPKVDATEDVSFWLALNRATSNINGQDYIVGNINVKRGEFTDIEVNVTTEIVNAINAGQGNINTLRIQRNAFIGTDGEEGADSVWYIDSISYYKGNGHVAKLTGTVLNSKETNNFVFGTRKSLSVTIEPADTEFTVSADEDNTSVTVVDNVIKTGSVKTTEPQYVYVTVGAVEYTIAIVVDQWEDTNIATGLLADLDEPEYVSLLSSMAGYSAYDITHLDATAATAELGVASSGVIKLTGSGYNTVKIPFNKAINKADIAGFYIKLKHNIDTSGNLYIAYIDDEGKALPEACAKVTQWTHDKINWVKDEMTTIFFAQDAMNTSWAYSAWKNVPEEIDHIVLYSIGESTIYVEEIGLVSEKDEGVFIDFNEKSDLNNVYTRWVNGSIILPGEEGYPADKGATTGVLKVTASGSNNVNIYPGVTVDGSKVSKIVLRLYVPQENTEAYVAVRLNVNATKGTYETVNQNTFDYSCIEVKGDGTLGNENHFFNKGAFVDVTFDVTGKLAAGPIHTLSFSRPWQTVDTGAYYIDSIRYVMA